MKKEISHIAIILDGNRRWAKKHNLPKRQGHKKGFQKIKELLNWCKELSIKETTLYCFSTENFKRDKKEVGYLFDLFKKQFDSFSNDRIIHDNKVKIRIIGRISMFPRDMRDRMKEVMKKTEHYGSYILNLALAYGGRQEIVDSVRRILRKKKQVTEKNISKNLYLTSEPDILIRPGGEQRLSNFITWQSVYTELIFIEKLWPDFTKADLMDCIKEYHRRERRFGV